MNSIRSIAIVATGPLARREATMPAAMSIWLSTQPPKIWPLALMSLGPGTTRRIGVAMVDRSLLVSFVGDRRHRHRGRSVAEEDQAHQRGAEQDGKPDARARSRSACGCAAARSPRATSSTAIAAIDERRARRHAHDALTNALSGADAAGWDGVGRGHRFPLAVDRESFKPMQTQRSQEAAHDDRGNSFDQGQRGGDHPRGHARCATRSRCSARGGSARCRWSTAAGSSASSPNATWSAALRDHGAEALDWPVEQAMSAPAMTVDTGTPVLAALAMMTSSGFAICRWSKAGEIRGIVSIGDLVKHRIERIEAEAEAMRTYIQSRLTTCEIARISATFATYDAAGSRDFFKISC